MNKLIKFFEDYLLKWLVGFAILFIPLYPKLPSIHITQTWVYIRLEDFLISIIVIFWVFLLVRKKISFPTKEGWPIIVYWFFGLLSLIFSLVFIGPHLANFFPKIAAFQYLRRIEYMILFFVGFSTVKTKRDVIDYVIILCLSTLGIILYGFGQKYYLLLWHQFPNFFEKNSFCFPSFQTGNEEFAKGIPLCLPADARTTSTFGGHYDLAAYLVVILPILIGSIFAIRKWLYRVGVLLLTFAGVCLLIFTASRVSFMAYLIGGIVLFIYLKQKKFIVPFLVISIAILLGFSSSTAKRFSETFRLTSIVTNNQGQVVGEAVNTLPQSLQKKISKNPVVVSAPPPTQNLPPSTAFIALPPVHTPVATSVAVVSTKLSTTTSKKLNLTYGGAQISTVSGSFLIQKAFVYDISFSTRFQGEWPNAWNAFMRNPLLGSGYSSITLASDNDFLRALGESGILGLGAFLFIFIILGIFLQQSEHEVTDAMTRVFGFGLACGIIGLFVNASLIDVFESSKVAETMWMLTGIGLGALYLDHKKTINYKQKLYSFFTSKILIGFFLFIGTLTFFLQSISNFFVGDDFTWLKWAASSTTVSVMKSFTDAGGFFYRPLPKVMMFLLYTVFSFQPEGYHFFNFILHWLMVLGVYFLALKIFNNKFYAIVSATLFLLLPSHGENVYWISTLSANCASVCMLYGILAFVQFRKNKSVILYSLSILLQLFAIFSYEMSVIYPLLLITNDLYFTRKMKLQVRFNAYIPFIVISLLYLPLRIVVHALPFGGDYAVNMSRLIPNFVGNLLGYLGIFIFGESFFSTYGTLRNIFRSQVLIITLIAIVVILMIAIIVYMKRKNILLTLKTKDTVLSLYLVVFIIISLFPFLGLGNISERYGYLASVGYVILASFIIERGISTVFKKSTMLKSTIATIIVVLIATYYTLNLNLEHDDWNKAGKITYNTLALFRSNYAYFAPNTELIFIKTPIRVKQAWVFPVGLNDGIWFIYREPSLSITKADSVNDAFEKRKTLLATGVPKVLIFSFDENGTLMEIE